jgi:methionyl-tRNA formyltransferase
MRIVLIGRAAFGAAVLKALIDKEMQVVGVYTNPDVPRLQPNPIKEVSQSHAIPLFQPQKWQDSATYEKYKQLAPDLCVMAFVTDIIPIHFIELPKLGTIEYHPSLLPAHRGASAINWAIIKGEKKTGLTIFWPDSGVDTGPILLQKEVEIGPNDTAGTLYHNKLFPLGVEASVRAIRMIEKSIAPRIEQDESKATYEPPCREEHAIIDWTKSIQEVYDLIRGTNPQPGATTYHQGEKLKIFDCEQRPVSGKSNPGEVAEILEEGMLISARKGGILAKRVQPSDSPKMTARQYVDSTHLVVGSILGR